LTYSSIKHAEAFNENSLTELIKDSVLLYNKFISELNENILNNSNNSIKEQIHFAKENLNILLLSYIYFNTDQNLSNIKFPKVSKENNSRVNNDKKDRENNTKKTKSLNIKSENKNEKNRTPMLSNNINIEFLKQIKIIDFDSNNYIDYQKFIVFAKLIELNLTKRNNILKTDSGTSKTKNLIKFHMDLDASITDEKEIENFNFFQDKFFGVKNIDSDLINLLDPQFQLKTFVNGVLMKQLIFLNQSYDYFKISDSVSGKIKIRREICKRMKINFIEYDFYEFLNYSYMRESDFELTQDNFEEYTDKIDEYITVKNEVYSK
jgi:hypothetical protein